MPDRADLDRLIVAISDAPPEPRRPLSAALNARWSKVLQRAAKPGQRHLPPADEET